MFVNSITLSLYLGNCHQCTVFLTSSHFSLSRGQFNHLKNLNAQVLSLIFACQLDHFLFFAIYDLLTSLAPFYMNRQQKSPVCLSNKESYRGLADKCLYNVNTSTSHHLFPWSIYMCHITFCGLQEKHCSHLSYHFKHIQSALSMEVILPFKMVKHFVLITSSHCICLGFVSFWLPGWK